jgi:LPS-assembly lipoprotein
MFVLSRLASLVASVRAKCSAGAALAISCAALALISTGCGFQLRGAAQLPFSTVYVQVADSSEFGHELKRILRSSNAQLANSSAAAQATLVIMSEFREKRILSLGGEGRVREYQLRYRIGYQLTDGKGKRFIAPTEILLTRDISFNDNEALAKDAEQALLYRDMQTDAVRQLVRRLQVANLNI